MQGSFLHHTPHLSLPCFWYLAQFMVAILWFSGYPNTHRRSVRVNMPGAKRQFLSVWRHARADGILPPCSQFAHRVTIRPGNLMYGDTPARARVQDPSRVSETVRLGAAAAKAATRGAAPQLLPALAAMIAVDSSGWNVPGLMG